MLRPTSSAATDRAKERKAAFVAAYTAPFTMPSWLTTLVLRMIRCAVVQDGQRLLDGEVGALGIDIELLVVMLFGGCIQRSKFCDTSVHEQNVDLSELLPHGSEQFIGIGKAGDVCLHGHHLFAKQSDGLV